MSMPVHKQPAIVPRTLAMEVVRSVKAAAPGMPVRLVIDGDGRWYITTRRPGCAALQVLPGTCGMYSAGITAAEVADDIRDRLRDLAGVVA